jgi:outer membrane protein, multidrug efflux system
MHSRMVVSATLLCIGLLSGCVLKDPPTMVQIHEQSGTLTRLPLDQAWKAGASAGPISDNWLASFGDPELTALVAEAMANNPDLRVTAARVEQAAQHLEIARSALRPKVDLFGTGGLKTGGGDALKAISLGVSWEPDLWGRLRYGRAAAEANLFSMQADFEFGRQSLAATLAKSWFAASETWLQMAATQEMVASGEELLRLEQKRTEVGSGDELSMVLSRVNLGNLQDTLEQTRFAHGQTLRAIELLVGRYPSAELAARRDLPALPGAIPAGLPIQMLERRPDMIAAERRVAAAFNRVGEAKAARFPRIVLKANVAALASEILQLKEDFENPTGGVGGTLLAPIYQGGALKTQVKIRTLEQKEAVAQYARLALRALGDVENALAASQSLAGRETMLRQNMTDQQRALELSRIRYRVGSTDFRSVQEQELNVNSARLALLRIQSEQLAQRANLHLALGGSFEAPPPEAASAPTGQP